MSFMGNFSKWVVYTLLTFSVFACSKDESAEPLPAEKPAELSEAAAAASLPPSAGTEALKGDGIADNRTVLQNLINTYAGNSEPLVLPAGKFLISDEILIPSNSSIEGAGSRTEIILSEGTAASRRVFKIASKKNSIRFKNFKINANQAANTGANLAALFISDNTNNIIAEGINFAGGHDYGSVQVKGLNAFQVSSLSFLNCRFSEAGRTALELRGTKDVLISKCIFENWGSQNPNSPAVQLQSQDNVNVQIVKNTFNNKFGSQFAIESAAAYVVNSKISDNKLNDLNNLGGNGISGYFKNTEISNNTLAGTPEKQYA